MRELRKLVLGETWTLPLGVALAVGAVALVRLAAGAGWGIGAGLAVALAVVLGVVVRVSARAG